MLPQRMSRAPQILPRGPRWLVVRLLLSKVDLNRSLPGISFPSLDERYARGDPVKDLQRLLRHRQTAHKTASDLDAATIHR